MADSSLGPTLSATLTTPSLDKSIEAYCGSLHHHVHSRGVVTEELAHRWSCESLVGAPMVWLANELNEPWLRLIEVKGSEATEPFRQSGWMSLEICVQDVDALRLELDDSPFRMIGEPANLDASEDIRAMQAVGPSGEVLYLTQIKAEVPPFELPFARCAVDRLFIPVLLAPDREQALAEYQRFPGISGTKFETKITVINRAWGLEIDHRHPVAAIQLRGNNLIEIDQLADVSMRHREPDGLPMGIAVITFAVASIPDTAQSHILSTGTFAGCKAALLQGAAGELIELIETEF